MSSKYILAWVDVAYTASQVYTSIKQEWEALEWTWQAWEIFIQAELATYSSETQYCLVVIRFIALVGCCLEYCNDYSFDWEDYVESDCLELAEYFELSNSLVKQLIGHPFDSSPDEDEDELDKNELFYLVNNVRLEVVAALIEGFGSESMLFDSLGQSNEPEMDEPEIDEDCNFYRTETEMMSSAILVENLAAQAEIYQAESVAQINIIDTLLRAANQLALFFNGEIIPNDYLKLIKFTEQRYDEFKFDDIKNVVTPEYPFSDNTFDLLAQLHQNPTRDFYLAHEDKFRKYVEQPFQKLFRQVAAQIPNGINKWMDLESHIFAYPRWDLYYQASFYPKQANSIYTAQLFIVINQYGLYFGFFAAADLDKRRFIDNCRKTSEAKTVILTKPIPNCRFFGSKDVIFSSNNFDAWLKNITRKNSLINHILAQGFLNKNEIVHFSYEQLSTQITQTFEQLFPLVLMAICDAPLPAIREYLNFHNQLSLRFSYKPSIPSEKIKLKPDYSLIKCAEEAGFDEGTLSQWVRAIERKGQAILYGSPGTGKTYIAEKLAQHLTGGSDGFWELVQFHPAYSYEDFIQGIRPQSQDGELKYPLVPGRFLEFCQKAQSCQGRCVLIIDEINRANLAQVFGELMYLLEYRSRSLALSGGGTLRIPANVRIIGTMNTADRSIALVDHALRRRFAFLSLYPNYDVLRRYHQRENTSFPVENLIRTLEHLNQAIADPHYQIGISFFLLKDIAIQLENIWQMEIEPYLEEYFFDQLDKVDEFRWNKIKTKISP